MTNKVLFLIGLFLFLIPKKEEIIKTINQKINNTSRDTSKNQAKYYGLSYGTEQIRQEINLVCNAINPNNADRASALIAETIAIESTNGNAKDYSNKYGEGLTQFDRGTFDYIKKRYSKGSTYETIKTLLGIDIKTVTYNQLRETSIISIIWARLLYLSIPHPIPNNFYDRWLYYKKYFNSYKGASTYDKYVKASEIAVIRVA